MYIALIGGMDRLERRYLLYRSLWKKKGYCHGCDSSGKCK